MRVYHVEFTKSARKEFDRLSVKMQDKILEALRLLSTNPFSDFLRTKKLKGADALYRIRLGDYRLIYEVRSEVLVVIVIKIGHRSEVYRNL